MAYTAAHELNGKIVLNTFIEKYYEENGFGITQEKLLSAVIGDKTRFLQTLGSAFNALENDYEALSDAMETLVSETGSKIPAQDAYFSAMRGEIGGFKIYTQALSQSVSQIGDGFVAVGDAAINTGKVLTLIFPFVAVGAALYLAYHYTKRAAV